MDPANADLIVRWTARAFVACYVGRLCFDAAGLRDSGSQRLARMIWTIGCAVCWIHFAVAFVLVHHSSLHEAYTHVLNVTARATGVKSGIGLAINVAFGFLWLADTALWWRDLRWSQRRLPYWIVQGLFAFLTFQATVVFGPRFWTATAFVVAILLAGLRFASAIRVPQPQPDNPS